MFLQDFQVKYTYLLSPCKSVYSILIRFTKEMPQLIHKHYFAEERELKPMLGFNLCDWNRTYDCKNPATLERVARKQTRQEQREKLVGRFFSLFIPFK